MIYLDNNATTRVADEVFAAMEPFLTDLYGNPSSAHTFGREMRTVIEKARGQVAELIGAADADEIVFTSGGTESDNWAILGALARQPEKKHIVTTRVEHEAVRKLCEKLEISGYEVTWLGVNEEGLLDLEELRAALRPDTAAVSIMLANNETGVLFPMLQIAPVIAAIKESSRALFHVDGVNAVGKIEIDLKNSGVDLFSLSGHKFHAPKGIGALYIRSGVNLPSIAIGGGQEKGRRAGTENVPYIAGLGAAAELVKDISAMERVAAMRDRFEEEVFHRFPNATLNGTAERAFRLPNTSSISFAGVNGEIILAKLNDAGICVSTGSACNSDDHTASGVLQAMNIPYERAMGAIRFSFGRYNMEEEVDLVSNELKKILTFTK